MGCYLEEYRAREGTWAARTVACKRRKHQRTSEKLLSTYMTVRNGFGGAIS